MAAGKDVLGLLERFDRLLRSPQLAHTQITEQRQNRGGHHHDQEDDEERQPARHPGIEHLGQEEKEEERAEQQNREGQDEEDTALQTLLDLARDLGLGKFNLGAHEGGDLCGRVLDEGPDGGLTRRAGVHIGERDGRDRVRYSISGEALALSVGQAHLSTSPGSSLASVAMAVEASSRAA